MASKSPPSPKRDLSEEEWEKKAELALRLGRVGLAMQYTWNAEVVSRE